MRFTDDSLANLEFGRLLELLAGLATFEGGRRDIAALAPQASAEELKRIHTLVGEIRQGLERGEGFNFSGLGDARSALNLLDVEGIVLEPGDILVIHQLMTVASETARALTAVEDPASPLRELGGSFPVLRSAIRLIEDKLDPSGEVPDRASPELATVRRQLRDLNESIQQAYARILDRAARQGLLQDSYVTVRNNRYVIPVKSQGQGAMEGIVHGTSSSGLTVFLEPFDMVSHNNRFIGLRDREQEIVQQILAQLTEVLRASRDDLERAWELLGVVDSLTARARFAVRFRAIAPLLDTGRYLVLEEARHPLLEDSLVPQGRAVVPISLALTPAESCLIISGPNTGGKTAALKTAGLLALMALSGIPVPAKQMECAVFTRVFAVIGDQQSLTDDLSTFASHVLSLKHMLDHYRHPALLLVDEIGTGTDPEEGAAVAMAVLDHFQRLRAPLIATTHTQALKEYALTTAGVVTAAVEIHPDTLEPTYHLHLGALGSSRGLFIARKLGLPEPVVADANRRLSGGRQLSEEVMARLNELVRKREAELADITRLKHEQILRKIHLERQAEERKRSVMRELRQEFDSVRRQFEAEKKALFEEVQRQAGAALAADRMQRRAERLLDAVERRLEPVIQEVPAARRPALRPLSAGELAVGMAVYVEPLHMSATVLDCGRDGVLVQAGDKRVRVPVAWLCRREEFAAPPPEESVPPRPAAAAEAADDTLAATELHVIGRSAEDALAELDRFLDLMFRQEQRKISVVHGMGRGILRAAIHRRLRETPFVRHFYHPPYADGGEGKTIVELDV